MRRKKISFFSLLLLVALSACTLSGGQQALQPPQPSRSPPDPQQPNLVALLFLRKDNLSNALKAEIYPIAFLLNDRYIDASIDVTQRPGYPAAIEAAKQKSLLKSIKQFFVVQQGELETFEVDKITPGRFQCSEILTGTGQFDQESLSDIFDQISPQHQEKESGYVDGKEFNQTLRWVLATSTHHPTSATPPTEQDQARYRRDLLAAHSSTSSNSTKDDSGPDKSELVALTIVDLNHDGSPEIFGKLRKSTPTPTDLTGPAAQQTAYTGLWLTYKDQQPQLLVDFSAEPTEANRGDGIDLVGTADITGDGIEEVIMRISSYESQSFGIYEYQNNTLKKVFQGAGFGC